MVATVGILQSDAYDRTTEMLDVAPFEFFAWLDKASIRMMNFPPEMLDDALDVKLHWVTEDGHAGQMRSGAQIKATVSSLIDSP